jgi:phenylalanyl-tRNA synthetase alpha chain
MKEKLAEIRALFESEKALPTTEAQVLDLKSKFTGKKGLLNSLMGELRTLDLEEKRKFGPLLNEVKSEIFNECDHLLNDITIKQINQKLESNSIDIFDLDSVSSKGQKSGGLHPITVIQDKIEDIFISMGFDVLDGPHIEDEFHNFEALNIPSDHPARDMQDTFWFKTSEGEQKRLLRTHTSTIQVRGMLERKPPFRFIAPGKVFRCERTDASHEMMFHQLEGMFVDKDVTVGNLIYFMETLLTEIFEKKVEVRLRPGFFPFVEPGFELDIKCLICSGKGCSVCKKVGWVELLPCGMVHPNVLESGGIDSSKYNGFAFGLGLDRLVMMKYGINDIRHIHGGDLRFFRQFSQY